MPPTASIIVPTSGRPAYLDVTLASVVPQARELGAEVVVVHDGTGRETRTIAATHGARYVPNSRTPGLNGARNTGIAASDAPLLVFVDDDIRAHPGWLAALLGAPETHELLTGPIVAVFEDHPLRVAGGAGPPITFLDLGDADTDSDRAWGANMAIRRGALDRLGWFDEGWTTGAGDEETWVRAYRAAGGRIRYVAAAAVDHRRAGRDALARNLAKAAYFRGRTARRYDEVRGEAPRPVHEARVLAGCLAHAARYATPNGLVLAAHAAGRIREAAARGGAAEAGGAAAPGGGPRYLSGTSGHVGGKRGALRLVADRSLDLADRATGRAAALRRRAAAGPVRNVLAIGAHRDRRAAIEARLLASHHEVTLDFRPVGTKGKFENLNAILGDHDLGTVDWLLVVDDDVVLPKGFLDVLLFAAERHDLKLAQPAQSLASHAAWPVVRREPFGFARTTSFVEIGPVTAFHRDTFSTLLPFPALRMAWGLDLHWAAVARDRGWAVGIVDAVPVRHEAQKVGASYGHDTAIAEAEAFLADRPYLDRDEVATLAVHPRR